MLVVNDPKGNQAPLRIVAHAFCETSVASESLSSCTNDLLMGGCDLEIRAGGVKDAFSLYSDAPTPRLIVLEVLENQQTDFLSHLDQLADVCDTGTLVVVLGTFENKAFHAELVSRCISEYVLIPQDAGKLVSLILRAVSDKLDDVGGGGEDHRSTLVVVGAKGGVGASTISMNVAKLAAGCYQENVVLLGLDMAWCASPVDRSYSKADMPLFSLKQVVDAGIDKFLIQLSEHLFVFNIPARLDDGWDICETVYGALIGSAHRKAAAVIVDLPHIWTRCVAAAMQSSSALAVVSSSDTLSITNANCIARYYNKNVLNKNEIFLIVNDTGTITKKKSEKIRKSGELEVLASIPFSPSLANGGEVEPSINKMFLSIVKRSLFQNKQPLKPLLSSTNEGGWWNYLWSLLDD